MQLEKVPATKIFNHYTGNFQSCGHDLIMLCSALSTTCWGLSQTNTILKTTYSNNPDSKVHGANMGPTWGRQDPGGPHVGPINFAIWEVYLNKIV